MNQSKKERVMETVQEIINLLPTQNRILIMPFFPQFRAWLDEVEENQIDNFINLVKQRIDYIEHGHEPDSE